MLISSCRIAMVVWHTADCTLKKIWQACIIWVRESSMDLEDFMQLLSDSRNAWLAIQEILLWDLEQLNWVDHLQATILVGDLQ